MSFFEVAYEGTPTWDIGRPQGAVVRLAEAGRIAGEVLDAGCGTGEHALYLAAWGHPVLGIDIAAAAIEKARLKADLRGLGPPAAGGAGAPAGGGDAEPATARFGNPRSRPDDATGRSRGVDFMVWDALRLAELARTFDTIIDVGLFHTLQPEQRAPYAASLRSALRPGGRAFLLCWSERNPFGYGPERIRRGDIRAAFHRGWVVDGIEEDELETHLPAGRVHAWLAELHGR